MKKALFTLFFITLSLFSNAAMDEIVLTKDGVARDRFDFPVPIDMPDLYYDSNTQEIIIDGGGEVNYYDVEIASVSAWTVVISTQVAMEGSDLATYEVGVEAMERYFLLQAYDMTTEAAVTKLMWLLGLDLSREEFKEAFYTPVAHDTVPFTLLK